MGVPVQHGRIVIAGGSGFLGVSLAGHLTELGYEVVVLSRRAAGASGGKGAGCGPWRQVTWDARTIGPWTKELDGAAGVVNLVGRSVDCIKTPDHCDEILRSRVEATRILGAAVRAVNSPPPVWVQMNTAHIYGDPPEAVCDEDSPFGYGLAPTVGRAWEEAFAAAVLPGGTQRGVVLRTSFVIGRPNTGGVGALGKLGRLARLGFGGTVGHGRQGMSWIHELDLNRLFERALTDASMRGAYIATAPSPVSNREFMRELRRHASGLGALGVGLPAAAWMVRLGAPLLVRTDPELALYGRYIVSRRLREEGFTFQFPMLSEALADLYHRAKG
ncbi:MAG: epimerase [Phycisphaerales bacterium]